MPSASVIKELNCINCGKPLVKDGKVKCPRCKQQIELPASLPKGKWFCPECQAHGFEKPHVLAIHSQIKCRWCGEDKNSLIKKEEKMSQIMELSEEQKQKIAEDLAAHQKRFEEYQKHEVYYIEKNQEVHFIPGGRMLMRAKYVYDRTDKMALAKLPLAEQVKPVLPGKELEEIVQHSKRALNKGTFVRKFYFSPRLFDLLEVMHGYDIPRSIDPKTGGKESEWHYHERKQKYLDNLFDLVISQG